MQNNWSMIDNLIKSYSGQANSISVQVNYIKLLDGDYMAAVLLSQIIYWSDRTSRKDGYFYHSYKEWEQELCLSQYRVSRAVNKLKKLGFVETKLLKAHGAPTLHYRVNIVNVRKELIKMLEILNGLSTNSIIDYEETQQSLDYEETQQSLTDINYNTNINHEEEHFVNSLNISSSIPEKKEMPTINPLPKAPPIIPQTKQPAVLAYKRILQTKRNPNRVQMVDIITTVKDISLWEDTIRHWLGHGWNSTNISGMLESYKKGGAKSCALCSRNEKPKQTSTKKDINYPTDEWEEFARMNKHNNYFGDIEKDWEESRPGQPLPDYLKRFIKPPTQEKK